MKICSNCAFKLKKTNPENFQFKIGKCAYCSEKSYVAEERHWGIQEEKFEGTKLFGKLFRDEK